MLKPLVEEEVVVQALRWRLLLSPRAVAEVAVVHGCVLSMPRLIFLLRWLSPSVMAARAACAEWPAQPVAVAASGETRLLERC